MAVGADIVQDNGEEEVKGSGRCEKCAEDKDTRGVGAHLKTAWCRARFVGVVVVEGKPGPGDAEGPRRHRAYSVSAHRRPRVKKRSSLCLGAGQCCRRTTRDVLVRKCVTCLMRMRVLGA